MARIRTIKPEFFRHEALQDLEAENPGQHVMLVFAGLWGHCDKMGRFEWRARMLKLDILPFLDFNMAKTLELLERANFIRKYIGEDGREYGEVMSFMKHQRISGKESQDEGKFPDPVEFTRGSNGEATGKHPVAQEGKGREEEGNKEGEEEGNGSTGSLHEPEPPAPPAEPPVPQKPAKPAREPKAGGNVSIADLVAKGVVEQHAKDWVKARGAPLTPTALAGMEREVAKAGIDLPLAVQICAEKGWRGFNADWNWQAVAAKIASASGGCASSPDPMEASRQRERELARRLLGLDASTQDFIDAESKEISA